MSTATDTTTPEEPSRWYFFSSRLGSLLAFAPLGVWTLVHLWNNLMAVRGGGEWEEAVTRYESPVTFWTVQVVIVAPLLFHTVWGIQRMIQGRQNVIRYSFFANVKFLLQRLSALGVLLFLGAHLWLAFLHPRFVEGHTEGFTDLATQMRTHLPTLLVYLLGTLGVAYHLANGVHTMLMTWGVTADRRAHQRLETPVLILFGLLLAMSWGAILALWNAAGPS